jgi:uncharacterized protein
MDQHSSSSSASIAVPLEGGDSGNVTTNGVKPVAASDRIKSIDAIRGVALLGILMMNIPGFGINWDFWYQILTGPREGADYKTFAVVFTFFEGTMRGLFSMLFGAGMVLFMQNKQDVPGGPPVSEYYYRRLMWLVLFGLFNAFILLWQGDILFFYGLCGMLLFPFRKFHPKWLIVIALVCMSITMVKWQWDWNETRTKRKAYNEAKAAQNDKKELTGDQQGAIATWEEIEKNQKPDTLWSNRNLRKMRGDYGTIFTYFIPRNSGGEVWYMYNGVWDMLMMMFFGMALYLLGFFSNKLRTSTYFMWLLIGYGVGIPIGWVLLDNAMYSTGHFSDYVDSMRIPHNVFGEFRRVFLTIGHASLVMLVFRSRIVPWLMKALANVGQMAFTNYLMQSIICTWFFYGYGFGNYNKLRFHQLYYVVISVWIFQLIFSTIWLRYFRFGPFEWLWRSLTYWKKQPMKK